MEKGTPHHKLEEVKRLVRDGSVSITAVAIDGALKLGLFRQDILDVVCSLSASDFYKSMTSYFDHKAWQDVYHPKTEAGTVYLKLTIQKGVLVLSFKEK